MSKTILVVDDDAQARAQLQRLLDARGHRVFEAADGREALNAIVFHQPDLVLLDVSMPVSDGFATVRRLRQAAPGRRLPVIVVGSVPPGDDARGAAREADGFLSKPVLSQDLESKVAAALRRP